MPIPTRILSPPVSSRLEPDAVSPAGTAFHSPLWWCALVALVANDHLLKGVQSVPGVVSGKLSDFAGMVVAPAVVVWLLRARSPGARMVCTAAVGGGLGAINLSPVIADRLVDAIASAGITWRIWPDASDLWALVVLPVGYVLTGPGAAARAMVPRLAPALGLLACLGSSAANDKPSSRPKGVTLRNVSESDAALIASTTDGAGGCDLYTQDRVAVLTPAAYLTRRAVVLEPEDTISLGDTECGAAWIQLEDGDDLHVYWRDLKSIRADTADSASIRERRRIRLAGEPRRWSFEVGEDLSRFEPDRAPPGSNCPEPNVVYSGTWSDLPMSQGWLDLVSVTPNANGCLDVLWQGEALAEADGGADVVDQTLCIPQWAFPFSEGESVSVLQEGQAQEGTLRITHYDRGAPTDQLVLWANASEPLDKPVDSFEVEECFGALSACGAYLRPVRVVLDDDEELLAGEQHTLDDGEADARVLVGTAVDVGWTTPSCSGSQARTGTNVNLIIHRKF